MPAAITRPAGRLPALPHGREGSPASGEVIGDGERHAGADPGGGARHAGSGEAQAAGQHDGGQGAHAQLHDAREGGHDALAQPLQRVAEDKEERQHPVHGGIDVQVGLGQADDFLLPVSHEQPDQFRPPGNIGGGYGDAEPHGHQVALEDAPADALQIPGSVILGHVRSHRDAEGHHGQRRHHVDFLGRAESRY